MTRALTLMLMVVSRSRRNSLRNLPMKMLVLLALGLLKLNAGVNARIPPSNLDDPELYEEYTTPSAKNEQAWWRETSQAKHTGVLFAGRTEFPWIVDIRHVDLDEEEWSTGNLITFLHVLTTCRAVGAWEYEVKENDLAVCADEKAKKDSKANCGPKDDNAHTEAPWWRLHWKYHKGLKVSYAPIYLWEDYRYTRWYEPFLTRQVFPTVTARPPPDSPPEVIADWEYRQEYLKIRRESDESGSRNVIQSYRHVWCDQETVEFDVGIIKLQKGIWPVSNVVKYMPTLLSEISSSIPEVDLQFMNDQRIVCYVASWGRSFFNWYHHMVMDYKVKYRVYYRDLFSDCGSDAQKLDFQRIHPDKPVRLFNDKYYTRRLWCFKSYQKIGTVCDHDRGAPLVCDGIVYGIVVRGAKYERCSNLVGQPFLVMRLSELNEYWQLVTSNVFNPKYEHVDFKDAGLLVDKPQPHTPPAVSPHAKSLGTTSFSMTLLTLVPLIGLVFRLLLPDCF